MKDVDKLKKDMDTLSEALDACRKVVWFDNHGNVGPRANLVAIEFRYRYDDEAKPVSTIEQLDASNPIDSRLIKQIVRAVESACKGYRGVIDYVDANISRADLPRAGS